MLYLLICIAFGGSLDQYFRDNVFKAFDQHRRFLQGDTCREESKDVAVCQMPVCEKNDDGLYQMFFCGMDYLGILGYNTQGACQAQGKDYAQAVWMEKNKCAKVEGGEYMVGCRQHNTMRVSRPCTGSDKPVEMQELLVSAIMPIPACDDRSKMSCDGTALKVSGYSNDQCTGEADFSMKISEQCFEFAMDSVKEDDVGDSCGGVQTTKEGKAAPMKMRLHCESGKMKMERCKADAKDVIAMKDDMSPTQTFKATTELSFKDKCHQDTKKVCENNKYAEKPDGSWKFTCDGTSLKWKKYDDTACAGTVTDQFDGTTGTCNSKSKFDQTEELLFGGKCESGKVVITPCTAKDSSGKAIDPKDITVKDGKLTVNVDGQDKELDANKVVQNSVASKEGASQVKDSNAPKTGVLPAGSAASALTCVFAFFVAAAFY